MFRQFDVSTGQCSDKKIETLTRRGAKSAGYRGICMCVRGGVIHFQLFVSASYLEYIFWLFVNIDLMKLYGHTQPDSSFL